MTDTSSFEVIIVGGSFSGLSAGMALGRALRNVLIIDSGRPCNRPTPYSHNFITQDGKAPKEIATLARQQVKAYKTISFYEGLASGAKKTANGFELMTDIGNIFTARRLIFATGVKDIMPNIKGFAECWGRSVIHCPYCHGYEVRNERTGIFANGDFAFHYAQLLYNWTKELTIFTNGKSTLNQEQLDKIEHHQIPVVQKEIASFEHHNGKVSQIVFADNSTFQLNAIYARPDFEQHCKIPMALGCELTEQGLLKVDMFQETTVEGVFACGDNANAFRAVSHAVAAGTTAGAALNNKMTEEEF
ncbi:MAG: NAD(P)/FAD-dependent oxidoreductase [Bacteroidota bacterium]